MPRSPRTTLTRVPLALISSLSITVMLPGTAAGDCLRRVAVNTWGNGWLSRNRSSASVALLYSGMPNNISHTEERGGGPKDTERP